MNLVVRGGAISSIAGDRPPTVNVDPSMIGEPDPAALRSPTSMIGKSRKGVGGVSGEYVPTTDEIRAGLIQGQIGAAQQSMDDPDVTLIRVECGRQFDRWLAEHDRKVAHAAYPVALVGAAQDNRLYEGFDSADRHTIRQRLMDMARRVKNEDGATL